MIGATKELFGYEPNQVIGKPITLIIPALTNNDDGVNLEKIESVKFFGGKSKNGICFPTMVNAATSRHILKIVSLPSIAGLITIHSTGKIQSINPVPAKYLFGYSTDTLVEKFDIDQIIPQFSDVVAGLCRCNLLKHCSTVNNHACRWAISDLCKTENYQQSADSRQQSLKSLERLPSISANGKALPLIHAVHRDGSQFEIQLQLRLIESEYENLISIWVTYDRIHAQKRYKKAAGAAASAAKISKQQHQEHIPMTNNVATSDNLSHPLSPVTSRPASVSSQLSQDSSTTAVSSTSTSTEKKKRPPIRTYGISSFGSVDKSKALFPQSMTDIDDSNSRSSSTYSSSEQVNQLQVQENNHKDENKKPHPMDDYVVVGTLGEGAYGTAKLAYRKDDTKKVKKDFFNNLVCEYLSNFFFIDQSCDQIYCKIQNYCRFMDKRSSTWLDTIRNSHIKEITRKSTRELLFIRKLYGR